MEKRFALTLAVACLTWSGCRREDEIKNGPKPEVAATEKADTPAEETSSAKKPSPPTAADRQRTAEPKVKPTSPAADSVEDEPSRSSEQTKGSTDDDGYSPADDGDGDSPGEAIDVADRGGTTRTAIKLPPEILDRYVGYYNMRPGLFLHVTRAEDQLYVQVTGRDTYPIYAEDETRFFYAATAADIVFDVGESGDTESLTLEMSAGNQVARKMPPDFKPPAPRQEVAVDLSVLQRYVGSYEIHDKKHVEITLEDGGLYAQLTDQPRFQIFPQSETRFFYKVFDVEISFAVRPDGEVVALTIHDGERQSVAKKME